MPFQGQPTINESRKLFELTQDFLSFRNISIYNVSYGKCGALLATSIERTTVIALIIRMLDYVRLKNTVISSAHLLNNRMLTAGTTAGCLVTTAENAVVGCVVDVVEGVGVADASP